MKTLRYKLVVYDFDGVLTDNRVYVSETGQEMVACNRSDGWWMGQIKKQGLEQLILSTEANPVVTARGRKLGIEVIQGQVDKGSALQKVLKDRSLRSEEIVYIGNDMNDLECLKMAGLSLAPSDSHPDILKMVHKVLPAIGGGGVVRHLYDLLFGAESSLGMG